MMNDLLLKAFAKSKMTAYRLEKLSGVSYSTISRWKRSETVLSVENAEAIAHSLGYVVRLKRSPKAKD